MEKVGNDKAGPVLLHMEAHVSQRRLLADKERLVLAQRCIQLCYKFFLCHERAGFADAQTMHDIDARVAAAEVVFEWWRVVEKRPYAEREQSAGETIGERSENLFAGTGRNKVKQSAQHKIAS